MKIPVEAFEIHCDGCNERFEAENFSIFTDDWSIEEYEWVVSDDGRAHLCFDCALRLRVLCEALTGER